MILKKSKPVLISFLICMICLTAIFESISAKINEDFQVSSNSEVVDNCEIAVGANGIAYIAYAPSGSYFIKVKKTTYGDVFEDVGTITTAGSTCIPKIAVDSDNNLYVVYNDNGYLKLQKLVGNTFISMITPLQITTTLPTIATVDNGAHKIVVIPYRISGDNAIYTLVSVDDGSFSQYTFVSSLDTQATCFSITLSYDGDMFYCALGHAYGFSPYYAKVTVNKFYFANSE